MDAAIVELDPLADTVRATTEDHDLLLIGRPDLGFVAVGRIEIRRERFELGGAGIDEAEDGLNPGSIALGVDLGRGDARGVRNLAIRETGFLGLTKQVDADGLTSRFERKLDVDDTPELTEEPRVNLGQVENLLLGKTSEQRIAQEERPLRIRASEAGANLGKVSVGIVAVLTPATEAPSADFERTEGLLEGLLEGTPDGHRFADGLHSRCERGVGADELLESEARDLRDDVVDGRLEAGRGRFRDIVLELVERVANGELGGDLSDREPGRLGGEG